MAQVLSLLSIAYNEPDTIIDSDFALSLPGVTDEQAQLLSTIKTRCTTLPLDYIKESHNVEPRAGEKAAVASATDLAVAAAKDALEQAGIDSKEIGLIVGGSATPHQTIPTESQRVGGGLGVKTTAYDINGSSGDISLQLSTMMQWKKERLPKYILCVSTNVPTQRVNYSSGLERTFLSDCAVAAIFSPTVSSDTQVIRAQYTTPTHELFDTQVKIYGHVELSSHDFFTFHDAKQREQISTFCKDADLSLDQLYCIPNHYPYMYTENLCSLPSENICNEIAHTGSSFSTTPYRVLSEKLPHLSARAHICIHSTGVGSGSGTVLMRKSSGAA